MRGVTLCQSRFSVKRLSGTRAIRGARPVRQRNLSVQACSHEAQLSIDMLCVRNGAVSARR